MEEEGRPGIFQLLVRVYRLLRGWGQTEFAAKADVDPSSVSHYETGGTVPGRRNQQKLAAAVDLPMPFVETCLRPALEAARAASAPFDDETFQDLEEAGAELDRAVSGTGRSAIALFAQTLEEEDLEPWERTGPPAEADRLGAADAWERLETCDAEQRRFLVKTCPELQTWAVAERLCHQSADAASVTAEGALELAKLACKVAELARCEEPFCSHLQGYTLAFLANARRVSTDLRGAKGDFARALKLWQAGAAAKPGLLAEWRILDLEASLRRDDRQFAEAQNLHERARAAAPPEAAGRILLKKSTTFVQMGEAERAIDTLREAAPLVDGQREPRLLFALRFNLSSALCDLERCTEAEALLPEVRELAAALRKELDQIRVVWLSGKISAGLGRAAEAEAAFEQVRQEFTTQKMPYDYALVTLDLAVLLLGQGRTAEVRELAVAMEKIFKAEEIDREALAALKLFWDAAKREAATVELARRAGAVLGKARHAPEVRFEAGNAAG
jgi:transcriptional regulator with XRE-family HTH domain